jgi:hypothetical protein
MKSFNRINRKKVCIIDIKKAEALIKIDVNFVGKVFFFHQKIRQLLQSKEEKIL